MQSGKCQLKERLFYAKRCKSTNLNAVITVLIVVIHSFGTFLGFIWTQHATHMTYLNVIAIVNYGMLAQKRHRVKSILGKMRTTTRLA